MKFPDRKTANFAEVLEREILLSEIEGLFFQFGIRGITMDDISRELGKSKKTLYKYFASKEELIRELLILRLGSDAKKIQEVIDSPLNAIDKMFSISNEITSKMKQMNPSLMSDLKKHYRETWEIIEKYKNEFIFKMILDNIKQGQEEDIYRNDLDQNLVAMFYIGHIEALLIKDPINSEMIDFVHFHTEMLAYHLRGISNQNGMDILNAKKIK